MKKYEISFNTIVAVLLATIAEDFGVTHRQIAEYIGTSRSTVSKTLNGQIEISASRLKFILLAITKLKQTTAIMPDAARVMIIATELEAKLVRSDLYKVNVVYDSLEPNLDDIAVVKLTFEANVSQGSTVDPRLLRLRKCVNS